MPIDQPPAIIQPAPLEQAPPFAPDDAQHLKSGKWFWVHYSYGPGRGWWAHIEGHAYPFGGWRMDRGPYPFKWMALLEFPIERMTKDGPRE